MRRAAGLLTTCLAALLTVLVAGCGDAGAPAAGLSERTVAVTVSVSQFRDLETRLHSVGRVVSQNTPRISAEIDAPVVEVMVDAGDAVEEGQELVRLDTTALELNRREAAAEIQRLAASISNEERRVARYQDLRRREVLAEERLDDAEAALAAYRAGMAAAEARLAVVEDRLRKARVLAPFDGMVQERFVSVGDFAKTGSPLLALTDTRRLRAEMPFPETVGARVRPGLPLLIESAVAQGLVVEATVDHVRPEVGSLNRAVVAIAHLENPGPWRPEATIEAYLVVDRRPGAVVVPSVSIVTRPAGQVVYLLEPGETPVVRERVVEPGERLNGWTEIRSGLESGESVVADGAAYLVDGARVSVQGREQ